MHLMAYSVCLNSEVLTVVSLVVVASYLASVHLVLVQLLLAPFLLIQMVSNANQLVVQVNCLVWGLLVWVLLV